MFNETLCVGPCFSEETRLEITKAGEAERSRYGRQQRERDMVTANGGSVSCQITHKKDVLHSIYSSTIHQRKM